MLGSRSSHVTNINREALPFICAHSLKQVCKREKNKCSKKKKEVVVLGFTLLWLSSILRKFCGVFSLLVCPRKIFVFLCYCACCSFSDSTSENCFKISSKQLRKLNKIANNFQNTSKLVGNFTFENIVFFVLLCLLFFQ